MRPDNNKKDGERKTKQRKTVGFKNESKASVFIV